MQYVAETLDRATGELATVDLGNWITITELGERYGVGPKQVRAVLHHMGLLRPEGPLGRYRLAPFAVARGYGKRLTPKKSKWPFDVLSPLGQKLVAACWDDTVADLAGELRADGAAKAAADALAAFKASRGRQMSTQEEVCWMRDHFPTLDRRTLAKVLGVSEQLAGRYANQQERRRDYLRRLQSLSLPQAPLQDAP